MVVLWALLVICVAIIVLGQFNPELAEALILLLFVVCVGAILIIGIVAALAG